MTSEPTKPAGEAQSVADHAVSRLKLYGSTLLVLSAVIGGGTALFINAVTADVKREIQDVKSDLDRRAYADSVRFERVITVVEYAVVAIVEPAGSEDRESAIAELKRRRHVASQ